MNFIDFLKFEPFLFALIAGLCIGIIAPLIGSVVVIRRLSFIADTLSHFSLAGVTIGVFLSKLLSQTKYGEAIKIDPFFFGIIFSIIGTFVIEKIRGFYKNYKELSMPILMSLGVALSGLFIVASDIQSTTINGLLFGSPLSIGGKDLILIIAFSITIFIFVFFFHKKIITLCFDEVYARVSGINVKLTQFAITVILALTISIFIDLVGVLLISALLIVPTAAAIIVGKSFKGTIIFSVIMCEIAIICGFYSSFIFELPLGATVVLLNILILFLVMFFIHIKRRINKGV